MIDTEELEALIRRIVREEIAAWEKRVRLADARRDLLETKRTLDRVKLQREIKEKRRALRARLLWVLKERIKRMEDDEC